MNERTALALRRAGADTLSEFQKQQSLPVTGIPDARTEAALQPWLLGYVTHVIRRGDTLWALSRRYGTALSRILAANPHLMPENLPIGAEVRIPLPFRLVPRDIPMTSAICRDCLEGLAVRCPAGETELLTTTASGRQIHSFRLGTGARRILLTAAHHGNEWITATLLLAFLEDCTEALIAGDRETEALFRENTVLFVPMVNPDGVDLVTGAIPPDSDEYRYARALAACYPSIPFPDGWKANLLGVDLNLNYPAGWEEAREIKFSRGFLLPGPRDYVGSVPLDQRETRALAKLTERFQPSLVLAFHSQGQVIYWQFRDIPVPGARALGERMAEASGYSLEDTPYASSFAGFKDWFIQAFHRPGYTVEVGFGTNPLPLGQFARIYEDNSRLLKVLLQQSSL